MGNKDSKGHNHHHDHLTAEASMRNEIAGNSNALEGAYNHVFGPVLGPKVWHYLTGSPDDRNVSSDEFGSKFASLTGNNDDSCLAVLLDERGTMNNQNITEAIHICRATAGIEFKESSDKKIINSIISALKSTNENVSIDELKDWIANTCPRLASSLKRTLVLGIQTAETHCDQPILPKSDLLSPMAIWLIQCSVPSYLIKPASSSAFEQSSVTDIPSCVPWDLLYSSENDGLSPNRFENKVFNYRSPTVVVVELMDGDLYCICADEEWKYSTQRWGKSGCAVYRILPKFELLESGSPSGMIFFNMKQRGLPQGLFVGSNPKNPVISIKEDFSNVRSIEVWGCGSTDTYQAQQSYRQWEKRQIEKQQKVPLPGNWEDSPDRMLLEMAGVNTQHAER